MSILSDAFQHTLNARERVVGVREKVKIDGKDYDALVEVISTSVDSVPGGFANPDGFRCQVAVSDFTTRPETGLTAQIRDLTLSVLGVDDVNGIVYQLIVGDPASL